MSSPREDGARPLITVVITAYNYAHYLPTSIGSVLGQDFPSFELLVVDNASTDDTTAVVANYAADPRLRYVRNPENIGLTPNHNRGLELARGEYVLFVSADDLLLPGHLRRCYDYLQAHPSVDVLYTGAIFLNAAGDVTGVRSMGGQLPVDYEGGRNEFAQQLSEGCYIPYPSMLIRRALYDELGPMDEAFIAADYEITVRWAAAGKRFAYLRMPSCGIRLHPPQASGATYAASGKDLSEYVAILEKHLTPANEALVHGYQARIIGHLGWRTDHFRNCTGREPEPELAARIAAMIERIGNIADSTADDDRRPAVSVIVRPGTLPQLARSLASLERQLDAPSWEAIVISEGGPDFSAILPTLPAADRTRYVRLDAANAADARNLGNRLAAGRIITYLEPGSAYEPGHLAGLAAAFAGGASVVRSNAVMLLADSRDGSPNTIFQEAAISGLYRGDDDDDRDLIAPGVPIDTVAHLRRAFVAAGAFRTDLAYGDTWEFWLRLRRLGVTFVPAASVRVGVLRAASVPNAAAFFGIANAIYAAYPVPADSDHARRRAAFAGSMSRWFANVPTLMTDQTAMVQYLAELHGIPRATAVAS